MDLYVNDTVYPVDKNVSIYIRSYVDNKLSGNPRLLSVHVLMYTLPFSI